MREITLTGGEICLVDDEDFESVSVYRWHIWSKGYAAAYINRRKVFMHHFLLSVPDGYVRDHVNGNRLDNRRANLRAATPLQNSANAKIRSDNTSGFKGVYWNKQYRRWKAQIRSGKKRVFLGRFDKVEDAARAYDKAASALFGDFAKLNFPLVM